MTQTPGADPIPLNEYEPLLLSTPEHFEKYWSAARPLIEKCVFYRKYWKKLCGWAYMNGVRVMEGWVAPGMERVISRYNFKRAYMLMRYDLTED